MVVPPPLSQNRKIVSLLIEKKLRGPVEYFSHIAPKCPQCGQYQQPAGMFKKHVLAEGGRPAGPPCLLRPGRRLLCACCIPQGGTIV